MTPFEFFTSGFWIGFMVAAPIGPIGILCIRQTIAYGFKIGFITGMGAAIADGVYATAITSSANLMHTITQNYAPVLYGLGGSFLIYLGTKIFRAPVVDTQKSQPMKRSSRAFNYVFFLTFMSPMTTILFITMFTNEGILMQRIGSQEVALTAAGVVSGATTWWLILAFTVKMIYTKFKSLKIFNWVNKIAGAGIAIYGLINIAKIF